MGHSIEMRIFGPVDLKFGLENSLCSFENKLKVILSLIRHMNY